MGILSSKPEPQAVTPTRNYLLRLEEKEYDATIRAARWQEELQWNEIPFSARRDAVPEAHRYELREVHLSRPFTRFRRIQPVQIRKPPECLEPHLQLIQGKVTANVKILTELAVVLGQQPLQQFPTKPYKEQELQKTSYLFQTTLAKFTQANEKYFTISKITSVENIFNSLHYSLAKQKYTSVYNEHVSDYIMFHGTKQEYLDGICTYNFDRSKIKTHKFGHGISFAKNPFYATHYHHDNKKKREKVMVIAKVLVEDLVDAGHENMIIPNQMCYTSTNHQTSVIVKYDDATFCPVNIIYYEGFHPSKTSRGFYAYL